ncbi:HNH endonuclease [Paracoccus liaowanqingii]|uniref:HNH endonuclease n=1 Tax=Paracoccus liaowanqingii TaxID=2560053 RepID=A0A4P7HLL7_9RHOB|nr:ABC-three component system protein [Paracoccus liaowanqingii]QBX35124.1 HNH endonuclease [Paracoccus liaowanqingii]
MAASYPTKIILAFRSGGVCAMPKCARHLTYNSPTGDDTYVGEAAHIKGEKPKAARYEADMTDVERDHIDNLLYLCTDDHTIIDKVPADWTTVKLLEIKTKHEMQVRQAMELAFADVAFPELQNAVAWVSNQPPATNGSFDLTAPEEKIKKNALSNGARNIIAAGMMSRDTVAAYVEAEAQLDSDFPERLKAGFLEEYFGQRKEGYKGDELFELMCAFAQRGLRKQADRTAGIAVLVYLFEICDVFEK